MDNERIVESHLRVRYAETDSMGIVYHANYLVWMEIGRTEFFRSLGYTYRDLERDYKLHTPVVELTCRYHAPARYDDEVTVRTRINKVNRRLIRFGYEIVIKPNNQLLCEGESVHLIVDSEHRRTLLPDIMLAALRPTTG
jgi:acyl-CoA thioester hydrolase